MTRKERIKSAYRQLVGSPGELLSQEDSIFRRMTELQAGSAERTI